MDDSKKKRYLKEIRADYNYFKDSYNRADLEIDIENIRLEDIPEMIIQELMKNKIITAPTSDQKL